MREKVFFAPEKLGLYLQDLLASGLATEAVLLSTCNRSELYCHTSNVQAVKEWFYRFDEGLQDALYCYQEKAAVEHLMKVACGLDSMVLGEPEILGQVKTAFSESASVGAVGNLFHRLFQQVFAIAKEIRSTTTIGACPVSIASTTMLLIKKLLSLAEARVALLGAGDMIELTLRYLQSTPTREIWIINRDLEKANRLAATYQGQARSLSALADVLTRATVLITATGSLEPIVTVPLLKSVMAQRQEPLYIFDIAVPRDVEAAAAALPGVKLYCIDDLKAIIQENQRTREHAAEKAYEVIAQKAEEFIVQLSSMDQVSDTIRAYRQQIEAICQEELNKALRQLLQYQGVTDHLIAERILRDFAYTLTNKLLHAPSVKLRQAGCEGRLDLLRLMKQVFTLPELDSKAV